MTIVVPRCPACGYLVEQCRCAQIKRMQIEEERKQIESGYYEQIRKEKEARKK